MLTVGDDLNKKIFHVDMIFREYKLGLVNFSREFVGRQDVAEDIVSEFFLNLLNKNLHFSTEVSLRAYLFTSVKNRSLDYIKHKEVENRFVQNAFNETVFVDGWEKRLDEELMDILFAEIRRLPKRCREIFLLHLDGLSNEEIAVRCNVSIETVKTQKKRAKKAIKDNLERKKDINLYILLLFLEIMYPL